MTATQIIRTKMETKISSLMDSQLRAAINMIHADIVDTNDPAKTKPERLTRALLLKEFAARHGEEACDILMDHMGL